MASGGKEPPDRSGGKFYKCHSDTKVNAVVCVICEDVYHPNDFAKNKSGIQLSDTLVICKDHKDLDLTSKSAEHVLEDESRKLIARIKLAAKEEIRKITQQFKQQYDKLVLEQDTKIREQVATIQQLEQQCITYQQTEKIKQVRFGENMELDQTFMEENRNDPSELQSIKTECNLLREINKELNEKNDILRELLKQEREKIKNSFKNRTFAEVTATEIVQKPKKIPRIIINKKSSEKKITLQDLKKKVSHYLIKDKIIKTNTIMEREKSDQIIINCNDQKSVNKALELLQSKVANVCTIGIEEFNKPKMKIVGIQNLENMSTDELEDDIYKRNFSDYNNQKCVILHSYTNKEKKSQTILIEVTADIYKHIRNNKNKVYVGHQKCIAYDVIDVKPCYNCGRFGHKSKKCRNAPTCIKCAGAHTESECEAETIICSNCLFSNNKHKTGYRLDHEATNFEKCEVFKFQVKKYIESTEYSVRPVIPRDIGKVGINSNKQMRQNFSSISTESLNKINVSIQSSK